MVVEGIEEAIVFLLQLIQARAQSSAGFSVDGVVVVGVFVVVLVVVLLLVVVFVEWLL